MKRILTVTMNPISFPLIVMSIENFSPHSGFGVAKLRRMEVINAIFNGYHHSASRNASTGSKDTNAPLEYYLIWKAG